MKICPILLAGVFANSDPNFEFDRDAEECREEKCAWWDSDYLLDGQTGEKGACAILRLGRAAERLGR